MKGLKDAKVDHDSAWSRDLVDKLSDARMADLQFMQFIMPLMASDGNVTAYFEPGRMEERIRKMLEDPNMRGDMSLEINAVKAIDGFFRANALAHADFASGIAERTERKAPRPTKAFVDDVKTIFCAGEEERLGRVMDDAERQQVLENVDSLIDACFDSSAMRSQADIINESFADVLFLDKDYDAYDVWADKYAAIMTHIGEPTPAKLGSRGRDGKWRNPDPKFKKDFYDNVAGNAIERSRKQEYWRGRVCEFELRQAQLASGADFNANAFGLEADIRAGIEDALSDNRDSLRAYLKEHKALYTSDVSRITAGKIVLPNRLKLTSKAVNAGISDLRIMDNSSGNPAAVSMNGGQNKQMMGYGYLAADNPTDISPVEVLGKDIVVRMADDDDPMNGNWKVVKNGSFGDPDVELATIDSVYRLANDNPEQVFYVFDPSDNPHGASDGQTPAPKAVQDRPYHRLSGIIARMIDDSQEAMVLKRKKKFVEASRIVVGRAVGTLKDALTVTPKQLADPLSSQPAFVEHLKKFREDFAKDLLAEMRENGSAKRLNLGYDECLLVTQAITPGFKVTVEGPDGSIRHVMLDASVVLGGDEKWAAKISEISEGGRITEASVYCTTLSAGAYRIHNAVSGLWHADGKTGEDEVHSLAYSIMNDWSDWKFNDLSISDVMSSVRPVGAARKAVVTAMASPTPVQQFLDATGSGRGSMVSKRGWATKGDPLPHDPSNGRYTASQRASSVIPDGRSYRIVQSFGGRDGVQGLLADIWNTKMRQLSDDREYIEEGGVAFVADDKDIERAVDWAYETGQKLLIPKSVFDTSDLTQRASNIVDSFSIQDGGSPIDVVVYDPKGDYIPYAQGKRMPTSSRQAMSQWEPSILMIDEDNVYRQADAAVYVTEQASRFHVDRDAVAKYAVEGLLPDAQNRDFSFATISQLKDAFDAVTVGGRMSTDADVWRAAGFDFSGYPKQRMATEVLMEEAYAFLADAADGKVDEDGIRHVGAKKDSVVAVLVDDSENPQQFAPILTPKNAPRDLDYAYATIVDGSVHVAYGGTFAITEGDGGNAHAKFGADRLADKGIVTKLPDTMHTPELVHSVAGKKRTVDWITTGDTALGRAIGRDIIRLRSNLWFYLQMENGSLFFKKKPDGKLGWRQQFLDDRWTDTMREELVRGDRDRWRDVAEGRLALFDSKRYPQANKVMEYVAAEALRYQVPHTALFSALEMDSDGKIGRHDSYVDFDMAFKNLSSNQLLTLFHAIDPHLCPNGINDPNWTPGSTVFDENGNILVTDSYFEKGSDGKRTQHKRSSYHMAFIGRHDFLGYFSNEEGISGKASNGWQHLYRRGMDNGYLAEDLKDAVLYSDFLSRNNDFLTTRSRIRTANLENPDVRQQRAEEARERFLNSAPMMSYSEYAHIEKRDAVGRTFERPPRLISGKDIVENPLSDPRVQRVMDAFHEIVPNGSYKLLCDLVCHQEGHTFNEEAGRNDINVKTLTEAASTVIDNIKTKGIPVTMYEGGRSVRDRYAVAQVDPRIVDLLWEDCDIVRSKNGTKSDFIKAIKEEQKNCDKAIRRIDGDNPTSLKKKRTMQLFAEYAHARWNESFETDYVYGGNYIDDVMRASNDLGRMLALGGRESNGMPVDLEEYKMLCSLSEKQLGDLRRTLEKSKGRIEARRGEDIEKVSGKRDDGPIITRILNTATETSKALALFSYETFEANFIDKGLTQTGMQLALKVGQKLHIGPYATNDFIDPAIKKQAVNDPFFMGVWLAYRSASFTGEELQFLASMHDADSVRTWLEERKDRLGPYAKFLDLTYNVASGGNKLMKQQMSNFLDLFCIFARENGQAFWVEKGDDGYSLLEKQLMADNGAGNWFVTLLGGQGKTPSFMIGQQAMNAAKKGDMAQRHAMTEIYGYFARKSPLFKFLATTCVSRFPNYAINKTERILNWVMPMSSIRYVFTEKLANMDVDAIKDMHLEQTQIHASLRQAMLVDITHLGASATAAVLIGMSGGIEPPDDEDKWGNIDEWTICGLRVKANWWMEDILGIALPLAAFQKSVMMGKPRIDIVTNGILQACYSNPVIRLSDACGIFADPEGRFVTDYEEDVEKYKEAKGGSPGWLEWIEGNGIQTGLSWVSQFFTPSIVKELYNNSQQWAASYANIFEENPAGGLSEKGAQGKTEKTTYLDAMVRRATRRNPFLGLIMDVLSPSSTGYMWHEMPNVIYRDQAQIDSMKYWSVKGLSDTEADAKLMEIIATMQRYDDMEELYKTGFFLDYETKAALSQTIWDTVHELDTQYSQLQASGQMDYYTLGDGDWAAGQAKAAEIKQYYKDQKKYWSDFYYDKIKSPAMSRPMVQYRMYNTTWEKDAKGEYYATGYRPNSFLPFVVAPGRLSDPEGTAGYENDWKTVSAVTGDPMAPRALVPVEQGREDWPDLKDWSSDKDGNGYSDRTNNRANSPADGGSGSQGSRKRRSGGYGRRGYGRRGGGGGYRSGGGGGSSKSPSIYSRFDAPNMNSPRLANQTNLSDPRYDYLRPEFETKGSREAYRRSDI